MTALIRFDQVTVALRNKTLISHVSFSLQVGEKAALQGRSGAGKSTVLKALLGFLPLAQGDIFFQGEPLTPSTARKLRAAAAYIAQEPILGAETVREALALPFQFKAHHERQPTEGELIQVLDDFQLSADLLKQPCARISVGEKQRVVLARAKLLGKRLYLLDEVASALDPESKQPVFRMLADPDLTVLSVAHDPDWISKCPTALVMDEGRLSQERYVADA